MPPPSAVKAVTDTADRSGPIDACAPLPIRPQRARRKILEAPRRVPWPTRRNSDPWFERLDLIEDDYYRLRNQPRG